MLLEEASLVTDMLRYARNVRGYLGDRSLADPDLDPIVRDAVYMNFILIGEALNASNKFGDLLVDRVTESFRIIGSRNQIVHGYSNLKHDWTDRTIQQKLPVLIQDLERLLSEAPPLPQGEA